MRIPIVDEQDNILYYKSTEERDRKNEVTRSSQVWIVNEKKEILLAKRSHKKDYFPNLWGPSASGIVEEGETYKENVLKETDEELGIILSKATLGPKTRESDNHECFMQYFFAQVSSDTEFTLDESEVDEVCWAPLQDLKDWYLKSPKEFIPTFNQSLEVLESFNLNKI